MVYKAKCKKTSNFYALKARSLRNHERLKDYLRSEYRNLKKLKSEYIVKVFELLENKYVSIIVMGYCEGGSLDTLTDKLRIK